MVAGDRRHCRSANLSEEAMGGGGLEKEGEENLTKDTPSKKVCRRRRDDNKGKGT